MHEPLPRLPALPPLENPLPFLARALAWSDSDHHKAQELLDGGLPPLATVRTLPFVFGVSHSFVNLMRRHPGRFYRQHTIPKASGDERIIQAPRVALKVIQRWIHEQILVPADHHGKGTAFRPGASIFANGAIHLGAKNLLQTDLVDFYGSIAPDSVARAYEMIGFPVLVAAQLTDLTTLADGLPQGAPSSPMLSNLVVGKMDGELGELAAALDARYSRYADDLTFSSSTHRFDEADVHAVAEIAEGHGFALHPKKTRLVGGGYRHVITGVSTTTRPQYPRAKRRAWRALFHHVRNDPSQFSDQRRRLLGIAAAVSAYDPELGAKYTDLALKVPHAVADGH